MVGEPQGIAMLGEVDGDAGGDTVGLHVRVGYPLLVALNRRQDRPPC